MEQLTRILVTGGHGFLGKAVCKRLSEDGYNHVIAIGSEHYNLTKEDAVKKLFDEKGPFDIVIHLAAALGGIGLIKEHPGKIYYENMIMNLLMQEKSRISNVSKFISIGSSRAYTEGIALPFKEEDLWKGYPEKTMAPYSLPKLSMLAQSQFYKLQYEFNAIHLIFPNLYGPGYNIKSENPHVIPSLIKKFIRAKKDQEKEVIMWGSGNATREFLYVDDAAEAIILALKKYNESEPLNIGFGEDITIKSLAEKIASILGYKGEIKWDKTKPEGQLKNVLDISRAKKTIGFSAKTSLDEGLNKTISWFSKELGF